MSGSPVCVCVCVCVCLLLFMSTFFWYHLLCLCILNLRAILAVKQNNPYRSQKQLRVWQYHKHIYKSYWPAGKKLIKINKSELTVSGQRLSDCLGVAIGSKCTEREINTCSPQTFSHRHTIQLGLGTVHIWTGTSTGIGTWNSVPVPNGTFFRYFTLCVIT